MHKVGDKLQVLNDNTNIVHLIDENFKMDNIIGTDSYSKNYVLTISKIDDEKVYLRAHDNKTYFIKYDDIDTFFENIRALRKEKLEKIFNR